MKIGFLLPAMMALQGPGGGVRAQAVYQIEALRNLGHDAIGLEPWNLTDISSLDVVQFFTGGYPMVTIEDSGNLGVRNLVWAPIIDTNVPNWSYRLAAWIGNLHPKIHTIPATFRAQALGCRLVICRSTHEYKRIVAGLGIDTSKIGIDIVLNGVNPPARPDASKCRAAFDLPDEFLLHVSAYTSARKNVLRLMDAAAEAKLPLVIAGTASQGHELRAIEEKARHLGNVTLLGFQSRPMLDSLFSACRVFCMPSVHEGTGLAALEAAACGAGVVITQNGGPPDYFESLGYYCDPNSTQSICEALQKAWREPRGQALQQHVLTNLTWEKSAESLLRAYNKYCTF